MKLLVALLAAIGTSFITRELVAWLGFGAGSAGQFAGWLSCFVFYSTMQGGLLDLSRASLNRGEGG